MSSLKASETPLEDFYRDLLNGRNPTSHIPRSDVFYVRLKYFNDTGNWETLDRIERAMFLEGKLSRRDVLDPDRPREWETAA